MRLLRALPQIEEKIESGRLPLSTLSQAQSFFRQEGICTPRAKMEVFCRLEGKSSREVEKLLVAESSMPENFIKERLRPISETLHHLNVTIDNELLKNMEELKALLSHSHPRMNIQELIKFTVGESLQRHRVKAPKLVAAEPTFAAATKVAPIEGEIPTLEMKSRYIPTELRRRVWHRDGGCCSYVDKKTGRRYGSRHFLELDHVQPFALGGAHTEENLRLRCGMHNRLAATEVFGQQKMDSYVDGARR